MKQAVNYRPRPSSAVERQEQELHFKRHHSPEQQAQPTNVNESNQPHSVEEYEAFRPD
jgi:hypothetical protein